MFFFRDKNKNVWLFYRFLNYLRILMGFRIFFLLILKKFVLLNLILTSNFFKFSIHTFNIYSLNF